MLEFVAAVDDVNVGAEALVDRVDEFRLGAEDALLVAAGCWNGRGDKAAIVAVFISTSPEAKRPGITTVRAPSDAP